MTTKVKLIWVTPFPQSVNADNRSGLEWYSRRVLEALATQRDDIAVIKQIEESQPTTGAFPGLQVIETWRRGLYPWGKILRAIRNVGGKRSIVHFQQEFFAYGGFPSALSVLVPLLILRVRGIKTVVTIHGVISPQLIDAEFVKDHGKRLPTFLVRWAFFWAYKIWVTLCHKVIVHDVVMRDILVNSYGAKPGKVAVIDLPVEESKNLPTEKLASNESLEILFFGFVVEYKGLETLLDAVELLATQGKLVQLTVAGGTNRKREDEPVYMNYYNGLKERALRLNKQFGAEVVNWHGFASEAEVPALMVQSDLLVMPYKYKLASSGPMNFAIGYQKLFLASAVFAQAIPDSFIYGTTATELAQKITDLVEDQAFRQAQSQQLGELLAERAPTEIARKHLAIYAGF